MQRKLVFAILSLILAACTVKPTPAPTASAPQMDAEEQSVYAAVLLKQYAAPDYVIMATTATGLTGPQNMSATLDHVLLNLHGVGTDTADSFQARNDAAHPVRPDLEIGAPYVLLTQNDKNLLFSQNQDGWQLFYEKHPDAPGITALSRVGFNQALDQALVYAGTQSHWLAGAGYYLLLDKINGAWVVEQQLMTWIS